MSDKEGKHEPSSCVESPSYLNLQWRESLCPSAFLGLPVPMDSSLGPSLDFPMIMQKYVPWLAKLLSLECSASHIWHVRQSLGSGGMLVLQELFG